MIVRSVLMLIDRCCPASSWTSTRWWSEQWSSVLSDHSKNTSIGYSHTT